MEASHSDIRHPDLHEGQVAAMTCGQKRRIIIGANSWGHTTMGILDVLLCARGRHPWRMVEPYPSHFWVCAPSYGVHKRVHWPVFEKYCNSTWIVDCNRKKHYVVIRRVDGGTCRIWFLSINPNSWRTLETQEELNGIWIDGPPREDHCDMAMEQIADSGGWLMLTFTPTTHSDWWWYSRIWREARANHNACKQQRTSLEPNDWWTYRARLATRNTDNHSEYEVGRVLVPHFRKAYDQTTRSYTVNPDCECEDEGTCNACRQRTVAFAKSYSFDALERRIRIFGDVPNPQTFVPRRRK